MPEGTEMRWLWVVVMAAALAGSRAFADSGESGGEPGAAGGGTVVGDPGYCWSEGVVPQPPPGGGEDGGVIISPPEGNVRPPEGDVSYLGANYGLFDAMPAGGGSLPTYGASVELGLVAPRGAIAAETTGAQQAVASRGERRSQMYIPPAVWKWVAEHPVRRR